MIVPRGKSYGVSVYDPALKRKRWVGTFATRREARAAERKAEQRTPQGETEDCAVFAGRWVDDYPRAAPATMRTYRYALRSFAQDFRGVPLTKVDRPVARAWALREPQSNVRVVRSMFTDAINDGLHPGPNPFANLRLEQPRGRKDLIALTEPQVHALADCALAVHGPFGPAFRAMILFASYVGLPPGELYALERSDVRADEVAIRQSLDGTGQIKRPKNGKERVVILPPQARDALRDMPAWVDVPWLFATPRGRRFSKGTHLYYWRPVRAAFGRPTMAFYELRHFCATHLLGLGVSHADVAVQLGHTDGGALVMSTYGHPTEDGARDRLKRAFGLNVAPLADTARSQSGSNRR
jgi:integrase